MKGYGLLKDVNPKDLGVVIDTMVNFGFLENYKENRYRYIREGKGEKSDKRLREFFECFLVKKR